MSIQTYTRVKKTVGWDINNPDDQDAGISVRLADRIATALPGKSFKVICEGTNCDVDVVETLTGPEITTLDTTVSDHKAATV